MEKLKFVSTDKLLVAGPCAAESFEQLCRVAEPLKDYPNFYFRAGLWKPRTLPNAFEGVGSKGLEWLKEIRKLYGVRVCTEVATPNHVEQCLDADLDALWIGARTSTSPFSVQDIADALSGTDKPVFVKNPLNPDLKLWVGAIERLRGAGCRNVIAVHRGFSLTDNGAYRQSPLWQIPIELKRSMSDVRILCDPSHIAGKSELVFSLAQTAMNLCFDGLMLEVHPNPKEAKTDARQQITPSELGNLIENLTIGLPEQLESESDLEILREKIDKIDSRIIDLLSERMDLSRQVSKIKMRNNMSVLQIRRWNSLLAQRLQEGCQKGLNNDFVKELFEQIHKESVAIQDKIVKEDQNNKAKQ